MYVSCDESGRICATTDQRNYADESYFKFDFPEDFDFSKQDEYCIVKGILTHDPRPIPVYQQIAELKQQLSDTDYVVAKLYESQVTGVPLSEEETIRYEETIQKRREWRTRVDQLLEGVSD